MWTIQQINKKRFGINNKLEKNIASRGGFRGGRAGRAPPIIRKAYVMQR